jgi:hypothetical protein
MPDENNTASPARFGRIDPFVWVAVVPWLSFAVLMTFISPLVGITLAVLLAGLVVFDSWANRPTPEPRRTTPTPPTRHSPVTPTSRTRAPAPGVGRPHRGEDPTTALHSGEQPRRVSPPPRPADQDGRHRTTPRPRQT